MGEGLAGHWKQDVKGFSAEGKHSESRVLVVTVSRSDSRGNLAWSLLPVLKLPFLMLYK